MKTLMRLKPFGIETFREALITVDINSLPDDFLENYSYCEPLDIEVELDEEKVFADRFDLALYLETVFKEDILDLIDKDQGVWTWICCLYFKQLSKKEKGKYSRADNYIYTPGRNEYRHCVATPVRLITQFEKDFARLLISEKVDTMGDMLEQVTSRQYIMRSQSYRKLILSLYKDANTGLPKTASASEPKGNILKTGKRSNRGQGSVRRLAKEIKRISINYKSDSMDTMSIKGVINPEFEKFESNI
jgi:hypothetical protein